MCKQLQVVTVFTKEPGEQPGFTTSASVATSHRIAWEQQCSKKLPCLACTSLTSPLLAKCRLTCLPKYNTSPATGEDADS